jgi:hypothetical protein
MSRESNLTFFDCGDCLATWDDWREDIALHGDTEREGDDIEKQEVGGIGRSSLSGEDTGLDGGTVRNSLIGVDALLELLAIEEIGEELLYPGDTGGATNKHDLINLLLAESGILQHLLNGLDGAVESLGIQVLETSTSDVGVEVLTIEERVNFNGSLGGVGKRSLGTLAGSSKTTEGTGIS